MKNWRFVSSASCALALALKASTVVAAITSIGVLTPAGTDPVDSRINAISPDGKWAVGSSNGQSVGGTTMSQAVIWSTSTGLVQIPNQPVGAADLPNHAHGVTYTSTGDLVVAGYFYDPVTFDYRMAAFNTTQANPAGGAWTVHTQHNQLVGSYNAARTQTQLDNSQLTLIAGRRGTGNRAIAWQTASTSFTDYRSSSNTPAGSVIVANTVSTVPRNAGSNIPVAAGYDNGNPSLAKRAMFMPAGNGTTQTIVPGGSLIESEALGMAPAATQTSALLVGYDKDASGNAHAFSWAVGEATMAFLGELAGDTQSTAIDARIIGGNRLIAGFSSNGTLEQAVVWDKTGIWDGSGSAKVLSTLLTNAGTDVSAWSSLTRITSMSDDGKTVAGWGVWAADGSTRGFVATIPEPATLALLSLGGLVMIRRRQA